MSIGRSHEPQTLRGRVRSAPPRAWRANPADTDLLLYDGECPACSAYVEIAHLRQLYPNIQLLDARAQPVLVTDLRNKGYDINEGMVLRLAGVVHFGVDATKAIAILGRNSPCRWRRAALTFLAALPYPWLNRTRLVLLRLLQRGLIG